MYNVPPVRFQKERPPWVSLFPYLFGIYGLDKPECSVDAEEGT